MKIDEMTEKADVDIWDEMDHECSKGDEIEARGDHLREQSWVDHFRC